MAEAKKKYTFRDGPYRSSGKRVQISWSSLGESSMHSFVSKVTELGYTVCFSRTSDGSSLSLTVMAGNEKIKEYIHPGDDLLNVIQSIMDYTEA